MRIYKDFPLAKILYYKIGGLAQYLIKVENKEDLVEALDFVKKNKIKRVLPIGLGSNILVNDNFFDGAVLWFTSSSQENIVQKDANLIEVFASVILDDLIQFSFSKNLIGLEWGGGLPSTIGGAVRGNVGAFGGEISSNVYKVQAIEMLNGKSLQKEFGNSDLNFSYRNSLIKQNKKLIILSCTFKLKKANLKMLGIAKKEYLSHIDYRNKNHPMEYPSCGSVFKNITRKEETEKIIGVWGDIRKLVNSKWYNKVSMGYVIARLGFSGFTIGGAKVSEKHGNYIVNFNNAKFDDVFNIIEKIKEKFYSIFAFYPEEEVEIVN